MATACLRVRSGFKWRVCLRVRSGFKWRQSAFGYDRDLNGNSPPSGTNGVKMATARLRVRQAFRWPFKYLHMVYKNR